MHVVQVSAGPLPNWVWYRLLNDQMILVIWSTARKKGELKVVSGIVGPMLCVHDMQPIQQAEPTMVIRITKN